jgi:hypothetical protein
MNHPQQAEIGYILLGEFPVANKDKKTAGKISKQTSYIIKIPAFENTHSSRVGEFLIIVQKTIRYDKKAGYTIGIAVKVIQSFPKENIDHSKY